MELQPESSKNRQNPTPRDIEDVLNGLGTRDDFVSMNGDDGFIQAAGSAAEGVSVEYGDGEGSLFRSVDEEVPIAKVIGMFKKYAAGDRSWKSELKWEDASEEMEAAEDSGERGESEESKKRRAMKAYYHAATGNPNSPHARGKGCAGALLFAILAAASLIAALASCA